LVTLADVPMPAAHADLFQAIPDTEFRFDLSSTQLRENGTAGRGQYPAPKPEAD
jgi:hypothetical protein